MLKRLVGGLLVGVVAGIVAALLIALVSLVLPGLSISASFWGAVFGVLAALWYIVFGENVLR